MVKARNKSVYICQSCAYQSAKWLGRCNDCGEWNSFVEEAAAPSRGKSAYEGVSGSKAEPLMLDDAEAESRAAAYRHPTGIEELDRVLGGGLVRDSFVLLGGDPGIGKSTLLLQMASGLMESKTSKVTKVLYASGEESPHQIRDRARRLKLPAQQGVMLLASTQIEEVLATVAAEHPEVLIVDSLQTFVSGALESAPGSVSQVREIAHQLMQLSKAKGMAVFLVGHVTKDGGIAGPKTIEHMVDTVLYFEGDSTQNFRLLRTVKNRFGSSRELGVFEMIADGLREVKNPSELFLGDRSQNVFGVAVGSSLEGSRSFLVELQALVSRSSLSFPRRTSVGLEANRLTLLVAILERHLQLKLSELDVYLNVAGGLRLEEPACDLAAAAAVSSSLYEVPIPREMLFIGELGLTGEVRSVSQIEARVSEAKKLGFDTVVLPKAQLGRVEGIPGLKWIPVKYLSELRELLPRAGTPRPSGTVVGHATNRRGPTFESDLSS